MMKSTLKVKSVTYDLSPRFATMEELKEHWKGLLEKHLAGGVEVLLFPEYSLMAVGDVAEVISKIKPEKELLTLSDYIWQDFVPWLNDHIRENFKQEALIVLGTGPYHAPGTNRFSNRTAVVTSSGLYTQDKIALTPFEATFVAGTDRPIYHFKGAKIAVLVCFEVEMPSIGMSLKQEGVDLILVPAATETSVGFDRVQRCASARAVELCTHVLTSHLVGVSSLEIVSDNIGLATLHVPAQSLWAKAPAQAVSMPIACGESVTEAVIDLSLREKQFKLIEETNPAVWLDSQYAAELYHVH
jgi:predicted amidohydrolase